MEEPVRVKTQGVFIHSEGGITLDIAAVNPAAEERLVKLLEKAFDETGELWIGWNNPQQKLFEVE